MKAHDKTPGSAKLPNVLWLPVAAILALNVVFYARADIPWGHDSEGHVGYALALVSVLRNQPAEALSFLETLPIRYPPLTYLVAAAPNLVRVHAWSFFSTTLFFALCAIVFVQRCAWALTRDAALSVFAVLLLLGQPTWFTVATSFNLEMGLVASTACACWLLVDTRFHATALRAALAGLAIGLCLLSKAIAWTMIGPMLVVFIWRAFSADGGSTLRVVRRLTLAVAALLTSSLWYFPQWRKVAEELAGDIGTLAQSRPRPWWTYLALLAFGANLLPFLIAVIASARRRCEKNAFVDGLIPVAGSAGGFLFFSVLGTKRDWYIFPAVLLLILAGLPFLSTLRREAPRVFGALAAFSVFASLISWLPIARPVAHWLSPAAQLPASVGDSRLNRFERIVVDKVLALQRDEGPGVYELISPNYPITAAKVNIALYLADPRLVFLRGVFIPYSVGTTRALLRDTQFVIVVRRWAANDRTIDMANDDFDPPVRQCAGVVNTAPDDFILLEKQRLSPEYEMAVYRDRKFLAGWDGSPKFGDLLNVYETRHYFGHLRYLFRAQAVCFRGDYDQAVRMFTMFQRYEPDNRTGKEFFARCRSFHGGR